MRLLLIVGVTLWTVPAVCADLELQSGFVESGGEQIYYEAVGEGEPVVLSHGLGGNHAIWYQQVPALAEHFRVITWDQRGFGRSTNVAEQSSPLAAVEDLKAILDTLEVTHAHLVGQSMGGWAVMGFAVKYPDRVASIVMADTIGGIYTDEISAGFDAYIRRAMASPPPPKLPITQHPALGDAIATHDPAHAFLYRQIGSTAAPAPANMGLLLRQTAYPLESIHALKTPVLFIVGEHDSIFSPDMIRAASAEVRGSQLVQLPGAGHSPYFETPDAWNETVLRFLNELSE